MTSVDLGYQNIDEPAVTAALSVATEAIKELDLSGNNISSTLCIEIANRYIKRMTKLQTLDFKDNRIGPQGWEALYNVLLKNCPELTYLDLNENAILDESLFFVALLLCENRLHFLSLGTNHLKPRGISTLCDGLLQTDVLKELSLDFNIIGNEGACELASALQAHPSLEVLNISDNRIGNVGAKALAKHLMASPHSRLVRMNLSVNSIGDEGFIAMADALVLNKQPFLRILDLGANTALTSTGRLYFMKKIGKMKYIRSIDMCSCGLTDTEVKVLLVSIKQPTSGLVNFEYYNNPLILPETEAILEETLGQAEDRKGDGFMSTTERKSLLESGSGWHFASAVTLVASLSVVAIAVYTRRQR